MGADGLSGFASDWARPVNITQVHCGIDGHEGLFELIDQPLTGMAVARQKHMYARTKQCSQVSCRRRGGMCRDLMVRRQPLVQSELNQGQASTSVIQHQGHAQKGDDENEGENSGTHPDLVSGGRALFSLATVSLAR